MVLKLVILSLIQQKKKKSDLEFETRLYSIFHLKLKN